MKNPFLSVSDADQTEYLSQRCSLNRAVLAELPLYGIDDGIEGLSFKEIFSTPAIVDEMRRCAKRYGVDLSSVPDYTLPQWLDIELRSGSARGRQMAERVVEKFGKRLGLLLLALRTGSPGNRAARPDWDDSCWTFWSELDTVILTGGLASSMLGRRLKEYIHTIFDAAGVKPYNIKLFDNGSFLGVMGLAQRLMPDNSSSLVLDMGHTGTKRALVRKGAGEIAGFTPMESLPSLYMQSRFDSDKEKYDMALKLHKRIVNMIASSYRELSAAEELSGFIPISIANYTHNGALNSERGGYAKLSLIGEDYAKVLEDDLSGELHRDIRIRLVHDSTASALYFSDIDNAVCVTLGTGFGVGFPNIRI